MSVRPLSLLAQNAYAPAMRLRSLHKIAACAGAAPLALLASQAISAGSGGGFGGHNSNAPVTVNADHEELLYRENRALLVGNVDVTQDDMRLHAARGVVAYSSANGSQQIHRLDATGGVVVTRGDENARGDVAIYDLDQRIITMVGNVVLHRGDDVLRGARLVIDLDSGQARVDGRGAGGPAAPDGSGRVSGTFTVPQKGK